MDWDTVTDQLKAPLDPKAIKPPPQGKYGEYVDGLHVIREANRIFGFDGWSYTVERLERTHYEVVDTGRGPQLRCSYLCAVRVNVDGVLREGLAVGVGNGKPENAGDVIESAVKEAETDALKRALRTFGNTFGLALYDKDKSAREVGTPEPTPAEKRDWVLNQMKLAKTKQRLSEWWNGEKVSGLVGSLPEPMTNQLRKAYSDTFESLVDDPARQAS